MLLTANGGVGGLAQQAEEIFRQAYLLKRPKPELEGILACLGLESSNSRFSLPELSPFILREAPKVWDRGYGRG